LDKIAQASLRLSGEAALDKIAQAILYRIMENLQVLLMDDEDDFRAALARRMTRRGIEVCDAASGEEGLKMLEQRPADVVILDVKMPGMGGVEALHHIKERYPSTEVIMLTGHASTQDGVEGIKAGAFDYLTKPIEFEHLLAKIRQAHEKIRLTAAEKEEAEFRERMKEQMIVTERLAAVGTLATGVAHEINNPLAIIRESAGWMGQIFAKTEMSGIPRRPDLDKALESINKAVERARRITHQLLQVVKSQDAAIAEVDLKELAEETMELVRRAAVNKNIEMVLASEEKKPLIWTDPYRLRQVLLNLLTNAIHATPEGGRISITIRVTPEGADLEVKDTGCGIPKENLAKIFEPFFSTKGAGEGTGMGLYVSRGIVEKLGGRIKVESRVGKGASFLVTLPLKGLNHRQSGK
jgi:two-component system, NtrC family, sensor kinase